MTSSAVIFALQYADDAAFARLTADGLQCRFDVMSETYLRAGLMINATKSEIPSASSPDDPTFSICGNQPNTPKRFLAWVQISYFLVTSQLRPKDAASLPHQPLAVWVKSVFGNKNLTTHTKIAVHDSVAVSTILHGCETWVPYRRHIRLLESFHIRRHQFILGIRWWRKVTHSEIRSGLEFHQSNPCSSIDSSAGWATSSECLIAACPIVCYMAN